MLLLLTLVTVFFAVPAIAADRCTPLEVEVLARLQASPQTIEEVRAYEWCHRTDGTFYLVRRETIRVDRRLMRLQPSGDRGPEILFDRAGESQREPREPEAASALPTSQ